MNHRNTHGLNLSTKECSYYLTIFSTYQYIFCRAILRENGCLELLLQQLKSPSLTIVSNACGTLWNLSARCPEDQHALWDLGAVPMLQSLRNSKHKTISTCSLAALKNLYAARPSGKITMILSYTPDKSSRLAFMVSISD